MTSHIAFKDKTTPPKNDLYCIKKTKKKSISLFLIITFKTELLMDEINKLLEV